MAHLGSRLFGLTGQRSLRSAPPHLVRPPEEAEAARRCLRYVETGGASGVVVVDLGCLGDAVQQLTVGHGGVEGERLAHHLGNIKNIFSATVIVLQRVATAFISAVSFPESTGELDEISPPLVVYKTLLS